MKGEHPNGDRGPWFEVAGHAVHAPLALVLACVASMLFTTIAKTSNHDWSGVLGYSSSAVLQGGEVWRLVSYVLWNEPRTALALQMLMLWWFGRELEAFFGRKIFLKLCLGIILVPALTGLVLGPFQHTQWVGLTGDFALFVAFATMAPEVALLFGVSAKWTALIFLGIQVLSDAAAHDWGHLLHSVSASLFAFGYVRFQQGRWEMPQFRMPRRRPQLRVLEAVPVEEREERVPAVSARALRGGSLPDGADALELIDPLLEKIGRSGLASLSVEERAQLELAREALIKKEAARS